MATAALETLQVAGVKLIQAESFFQAIPVMYERLENVTAKLAEALNRLKGIAILVLTPVGRNSTPNNPSPFLNVTLAVQVAENVLINNSSKGTKIPCSAVAEQVAAHLHLAPWTDGKVLVLEDIKLSPNKSGALTYSVTFSTGVILTKIT